jgi:hypothetical protein
MNDPLQILSHRTDNEKLSDTLDASSSARRPNARVSPSLLAMASLASISRPLSIDTWTPPQARRRVDTSLIAECLRQCVAAPTKQDRQRHKRQLIGFLQLDGHSASDARTLADRMIAERRRSA